MCVAPAGHVGVPEILVSLFSLTPLSFSPIPLDPERGIQIFIHAIRTANGYHLRSRGSLLTLDLRAGRAEGSSHPVAIAGPDRNVTPGAVVKLDGSTFFSGNGSALISIWKLISIPPGSAAVLSGADSPTPWFVPDREGVYVAQLIVDDGAGHSTPSTVSITAAGNAR
jgi:hypothetical protein